MAVTEERLFELLHQRGCIARVRDPLPEDDPRKVQKIQYLTQSLNKQRDPVGRLHPHYGRTDNGRVKTWNPNILGLHIIEGPPGVELAQIAPTAFEAAWWVKQLGDRELAERMARHGVVEALSLPDREPRAVKESFFRGLYGGPAPLWDEIVAAHPILNTNRPTNPDERRVANGRMQHQITNLVLAVACEFEERHPGLLVAVWHDDIVLEGYGLKKFEDEIKEHYRRLTNLPFALSVRGTAAMPSGVTRLELLLDEDL